jgi:hypothetical protein
MIKKMQEFCMCLWKHAYHDKKCRFNCANKLIRLEKRRPPIGLSKIVSIEDLNIYFIHERW